MASHCEVCVKEINDGFDPGLKVTVHDAEFAFSYGPEVVGPLAELRRLQEIRPSLMDPGCTGPDPVYGIAMDVRHRQDTEDLEKRYLLFGVVAYAAGRLGDEPVRSQGHIHARAPHCGWSTPEVFEIWEGRGIIYAQESAGDDPGRCVAVEAGPGEQVVVPPGWAHCVINASEEKRLIFGALCDRQYAFEYSAVRAHGGLAWFPLLRDGGIRWQPNSRYQKSSLAIRKVRAYPELGLDSSIPIYLQYRRNPEAVQWVSEPARLAPLWPCLEP